MLWNPDNVDKGGGGGKQESKGKTQCLFRVCSCVISDSMYVCVCLVNDNVFFFFLLLFNVLVAVVVESCGSFSLLHYGALRVSV